MKSFSTGSVKYLPCIAVVYLAGDAKRLQRQNFVNFGDKAEKIVDI